MLMKTAALCLTEQLASRFAELIRTRLLSPGALFHPGRKPSKLMRINFPTTQAVAFWGVFARVRGG